MLKYCCLFIVFCGLFVNVAYSMACYYCSSSIHGQCAENPKSLWPVDCNDVILDSDYLDNGTAATGCIKRITTYNDFKIVRECYYGDLNDAAPTCLDKWSSFTYLDRIINCEVCDSDGCSSANWSYDSDNFSSYEHFYIATILYHSTYIDF